MEADEIDFGRGTDALRCECSRCGKKFMVVGRNTKPTADTAVIDISQCESQGVYGIDVTCPHCKFGYDLMY